MKKAYRCPEVNVLFFETELSLLVPSNESSSQGTPGDEGDARPRGFSDYEYSSSNSNRNRQSGRNGGSSGRGWGSLW